MSLATRPVEPVALSITEVMAATGLCRTTIYKEIASGRMRSFKVGKRRFVARVALDRWVEILEERAA